MSIVQILYEGNNILNGTTRLMLFCYCELVSPSATAFFYSTCTILYFAFFIFLFSVIYKTTTEKLMPWLWMQQNAAQLPWNRSTFIMDAWKVGSHCEINFKLDKHLLKWDSFSVWPPTSSADQFFFSSLVDFWFCMSFVLELKIHLRRQQTYWAQTCANGHRIQLYNKVAHIISINVFCTRHNQLLHSTISFVAG